MSGLNETEKQHALLSDDLAVCVQNGKKSYRMNKTQMEVLNTINIRVSKGTIYGLLGPSGCGKTTLLSCIVGRKKLDSGAIWVLGGAPCTKGSGVPGKRIGYMPQEIALLKEFSIKETMMYFGWIFGMKTFEIENKLETLLKILDLPNPNRLIRNLSGGQQRRISFAVALIHDPELMILDEPTVGVDPILRQTIWNHLVDITKGGLTSVIITTHYIEEAKQAHTIGLMRNGRLLAEESPQSLLSKYKCTTLEKVFFMLSNIDGPLERSILDEKDGKDLSVTFSKHLNSVNINDDDFRETTSKRNPFHVDFTCSFTDKGKMRALLMKNFLKMWRNIGTILFIFGIPIMQVVLFCLAIGGEPRGLILAVVNEDFLPDEDSSTYSNEVTSLSSLSTFSPDNSSSTFSPIKPIKLCDEKNVTDFNEFSCHILQRLKKNGIDLQYYKMVDQAIEAVKKGNAWGLLYFHSSYSNSLKDFYDLGKFINEVEIDAAQMQVWLDMSNQQIGIMLVNKISDAYNNFSVEIERVYLEPNENPIVDKRAIQLMEPIYGKVNPNFKDFIAPGITLMILFFLAVGLTACSLVSEQNEGILERSLVAGVRPAEVLMSHAMIQLLTVCGQVSVVLVFIHLIFSTPCEGNIFIMILLCILQGICGMCFGLTISSVCDIERTAIIVSLGVFYPTLLLSGIIWPVEGIPKYLQILARLLPLTSATTSLHSITLRGLSLTNPQVYMGFVSTFVWIGIFLILTMVLLTIKKKLNR